MMSASIYEPCVVALLSHAAVCMLSMPYYAIAAVEFSKIERNFPTALARLDRGGASAE
jgi:hypothetical protein